MGVGVLFSFVSPVMEAAGIKAAAGVGLSPFCTIAHIRGSVDLMKAFILKAFIMLLRPSIIPSPRMLIITYS